MHPRSANDVPVNAQERKNTRLCSVRSTYFLYTADSERRPKTQNSSRCKTPKNSHTDKKIRHAHAHVQNDASTHTYFYAHPYTRKRIKHTRDCNLIALNASHKYTCILFLIFFPLIFWSRGFVCLPKKQRYYRTTSNAKKT